MVEVLRVKVNPNGARLSALSGRCKKTSARTQAAMRVGSRKALYIGMSEDVMKRLTDHNTGVSTWTKHRGPWELAWQSGLMEITAARKLENLLKRQKGGRGLYELTGMPRPQDPGS